ncbi:MAG TPA: hypothetical protein DHW22_05930 [Planctomycetaceae bacterium]|nr:hypothetical protein [Planctomycetaceae bacterium]
MNRFKVKLPINASIAGSPSAVSSTMKKTPLLCLSILLLPICSVAIGQKTPTPASERNPLFVQSNIEKAWKTAVLQKKPILVMFTSDHCKFCEKMLTETYGHPVIKQMLTQRTETVLAHAKEYRDLTKKLGIRGYPTTLLISPKGEVLDLMQGYVAPKAFAERVKPLLAGPNVQTMAAATPNTSKAVER